jgi:hypothetical protein
VISKSHTPQKTLKDIPEFHQRYSQGFQVQAPQKVAAHTLADLLFVTPKKGEKNHLSREFLTLTI